ncbi:MAG: hypothetical protein ABF608_03785 [Sporolactobacillus sp.]
MKKMIVSIVLAVLIAILIGWPVSIYELHRAYFNGAADEYIAAQQIPQSRIIGKPKTWYNYDGGTWEKSIRVETRRHILNYYYTMQYKSKSLMLSVYQGRNGITSTKLEYPPLSYDK